MKTIINTERELQWFVAGLMIGCLLGFYIAIDFIFKGVLR